MYGMLVQAGHYRGPRTLWHWGDELAQARRPSGVGVVHADLDQRSRRTGLSSPALPTPHIGGDEAAEEGLRTMHHNNALEYKGMV